MLFAYLDSPQLVYTAIYTHPCTHSPACNRHLHSHAETLFVQTKCPEKDNDVGTMRRCDRASFPSTPRLDAALARAM